MILNQGVPEPIPFTGQFWIDGTGDTAIKHPKQNLKVKSFRDDHGIVEVREQRVDETLYTKTSPTLVEIEPGLWERQYTAVPKNLESQKARVIQAITSMRERVLRGGITVLTKPMSTDSGDIDKYNSIASAVGMGTPYPASGIKAFTLTGERVNINAVNFGKLMEAIATHFIMTDNNADQHISAVEALTTEQEVIDYDYSVGWPPNPVIA